MQCAATSAWTAPLAPRSTPFPLVPSGQIDSGAEELCETACLLLGGHGVAISLHSGAGGTGEVLHHYERRAGHAAPAVRVAESLDLARRRLDGGIESVSTTLDAVEVRSFVFRPGASTAVALSVSADGGALRGDSATGHGVARMLALWWQLRSSEHEGRALRHAIDMSEVGALILDAKMRVKFANTCARILLGQGDGLVAQAGGVSAHHLDDAIRLQLIVQRVIERGGAADTEIPVVSVRRVGRRPLVATVVGTSRRALQPADAAAILFVLDPEQDVLRMLGASCGLYGLTETESRLTKHLVSGLTVTEAAAAMRIQCATARAYLKQIFAKTGTHRQTDLVRLMLLSVVRMPGTVQFHAVG